MSEKAVVYYRTSPSPYRYDLTLEEQKSWVSRFIKNSQYEIISEYLDEAYPRGNNRPQLAAALKRARKEKLPVIVAQVRVITNHAYFLATLLDRKIKIIPVEAPYSNELIIHTLCIVAEHHDELLMDEEFDEATKLQDCKGDDYLLLDIFSNCPKLVEEIRYWQKFDEDE